MTARLLTCKTGFRIAIFEACSAFTHVMAFVLARITHVILYIEGFSRFVASTTAPIATGWSDSVPGGIRTHWKNAPFHGAQESHG
jgi:hypothetical protein